MRWRSSPSLLKCRWLPQNKKSPEFFFLTEQGLFYTSLLWGKPEHSKVLKPFQWGPAIGVWWWNSRCHTVIIATNACRTFGATKLTLVVYAVQLFSSLVLVWWKRSSEKGDHCRCYACNHVFVDKSKWLWFNIILPAHVFSVHPSVCFLPLWKTPLH